MTPEQELKIMWPKASASTWPFPTSYPEESRAEKKEAVEKLEEKAKSPVPVITGARGQTYSINLTTGANGTSASDFVSTTLPPYDWGKLTVTGATVATVTSTDKTIQVLDERAKNYGLFKDMAAITQNFKEILHSAPSWKTMQADQQESLEMIVHKIARILNGRPDYADSWVDIAGYARLVSERLEKGITR